MTARIVRRSGAAALAGTVAMLAIVCGPASAGTGVVQGQLGFARTSAASAVTVDAQGKIVVAGVADHFMLARYSAAGMLDTSFSGDGIVTDGPGGRAFDVVADGEGRLVAVGYGSDSAGRFAAVRRYQSNGLPDFTFGTFGLQAAGKGTSAEARGVAIDGRGRLVVVGSSLRLGGDFAVWRFNADGTPDTSFSGDGAVTTAFPDRAGGGARDVLIDASGRIVVTGSSGSAAGTPAALARYNDDGSLDSSFSGDGMQLAWGGNAHAAAVALDGEGRIVTAGTHDQHAVSRYTSSGEPDPSFSEDGREQPPALAGSAGAALAVDSTGKVLSAGATSSSGSPVAGHVVRMNADGTLDSSFAGDGIASSSYGGLSAMALDAQGRIVAAGASNEGSVLLMRYKADGTLDTTFGPNPPVAPRASQISIVFSRTLSGILAAGRLRLRMPVRERGVTLTTTLSVAPAVARKLGLKGRTVGKGSSMSARSGPVEVDVWLTSRASRALRKGTVRRVTVTASTVLTKPGVSSSVTRRFTLTG